VTYETAHTSPHHTASIVTTSVLAINTAASRLLYQYSYCVLVPQSQCSEPGFSVSD